MAFLCGNFMARYMIQSCDHKSRIAHCRNSMMISKNCVQINLKSSITVSNRRLLPPCSVTKAVLDVETPSEKLRLLLSGILLVLSHYIPFIKNASSYYSSFKTIYAGTKEMEFLLKKIFQDCPPIQDHKEKSNNTTEVEELLTKINFFICQVNNRHIEISSAMHAIKKRLQTIEKMLVDQDVKHDGGLKHKLAEVVLLIVFTIGVVNIVTYQRVMASEMENEEINEAGKQFNIEKPGDGQDTLEDMTIIEEPTIVDFERLVELIDYSERGSSQLADLVKNWEYKQANAVRLLREELDSLCRPQHEVELKKLEILEEHPITMLDGVVIDAEDDIVKYWKQRATNLDILLEASIQREQLLQGKLQESIENLERQSSPVEELSQVLKRGNFLHFVLQNAPVVIGNQDKDLRYRFIYNHFPRFREEESIGKTDVEIFTGRGIKESQDFKKEVLEKGLPAKREITFETESFGSKTFLLYVEPVFSKAGETIGINYLGMEVTDQVA